jgi:hypothetical protein
MVPVVVFNDRPAGKLPAVMEYVNGGVPFVINV